MTDPATGPAPAAPPASGAAPATPPAARRTRGALLRYRGMAIFTGIGLIILTFVAIPLQIWADNDALVHVFGFIHGWGFIVYLLTVADLGLRLRWSLPRLLLVAVAGTVPFCSFIAEHQMMKRIRVEHPELSAPAPQAPAAGR